MNECPRVGKNSTLSSVGSQHEAPQSGHGGGRGNVDRVSSSNHNGGGGNGLHNISTAIDSRSEKTHATERIESSPLKTELIQGSHEKSNSSVIEVISEL